MIRTRFRFHRIGLRLCALVAAALPIAAAAQLRVDWWTVDGGGGTSAAGPYAITGTVGQAEPESVSMCSPDGGPLCVQPMYAISGGFWTGAAAPDGNGGNCGGVPDCLLRDGFEDNEAAP